MSWTRLLSRALSPLSPPERRGWRQAVRIPTLVVDASGRRHPGELVEAGARGFRMRVKRALPRGRRLTFQFRSRPDPRDGPGGLTGQGETLEVAGEVLWRRRNGWGGYGYSAGGRFLTNDPLELTRLHQLFGLSQVVIESTEIERRGASRVPYQDSLRAREQAVRDLSESGAGLLVRAPVPLGQLLTLPLQNSQGPFQCEARPIRSQELLQGRVYLIGLTFHKPQKETYLEISRLLSETLAAREGQPHSPPEPPLG